MSKEPDAALPQAGGSDAAQDVVKGKEKSECLICFRHCGISGPSSPQFRPCRCVYQICPYCWYRIYRSENPRCPACRSTYSGGYCLFQLHNTIIPQMESLHLTTPLTFKLVCALAYFDSGWDIPATVLRGERADCTGELAFLEAEGLITLNTVSSPVVAFRVKKKIQRVVRRFASTSSTLSVCMQYVGRRIGTGFGDQQLKSLTTHDTVKNYLVHAMSIWKHFVKTRQELSNEAFYYFSALCQRCSELSLYRCLLQLTSGAVLVSVPAHHPWLIEAKANMGKSLWRNDSGKVDEALTILNRVLDETKDSRLLLSQKARITALQEIAAIQAHTGDLASAVQTSEAAFQLSLEIYVLAHKIYFAGQRNRAEILAKFGKVDESISILKAAYIQEITAKGSGGLYTQLLMGQVSQEHNKLNDAEIVYGDLLRKLLLMEDLDDMLTLDCSLGFTRVLNLMKKFKEALSVCETILWLPSISKPPSGSEYLRLYVIEISKLKMEKEYALQGMLKNSSDGATTQASQNTSLTFLELGLQSAIKNAFKPSSI